MASTTSPSRPRQVGRRPRRRAAATCGRASYCWRKCSRRDHRLSATSAAVVRARVGQPPRRSTRAIRPPQLVAREPPAVAEVGGGEPAQRVGDEQPVGAGVLDPVGGQRDARRRPPRRRSTGPRRPGVDRGQAGLGDVGLAAPVGEVRRVAELGRVVRRRAGQPLDRQRAGRRARCARRRRWTVPVPPGTESHPGSGSHMRRDANRCRARGSATTRRPSSAAASAVRTSAGAGAKRLDRHRGHVGVRREAGHPARQLEQLAELAEHEERRQHAPSRAPPTGSRRRTAAGPAPRTTQTAGAWASAAPTKLAEPSPPPPAWRPSPRAVADAGDQQQPGRADQRDDRGREEGARPRGGGGQHLLGAAVVLVAAAVADDGDGEAGDDHAGDREHGARPGCPAARRRRRGARSSARPASVSSRSPTLGRDRAHHQRPARRTPTVQDQHRGAVHPQAQRERVGQPGRARRPGPGRGGHQPGTEVAAVAAATGGDRDERRAERRGRAAAPTSAGRTRRAAGWTSRTARASDSQPGRVSPTARSTKRTPMAAAGDRRRRCGRWRRAGRPRRSSPVPTSPMPAQDAAERRATRRPAARRRCRASGGQHARATSGDHADSSDGGGERRVAADRRAAEQLGAPGLLLDAGVAADQHEEEQRHEHGVQHGHLGHRQLAEAVHVEDRAVERDDRRAGVDRLGGGDPVGRRSGTGRRSPRPRRSTTTTSSSTQHRASTRSRRSAAPDERPGAGVRRSSRPSACRVGR